MSLARIGFCRFSVREAKTPGNWSTVFQGDAAAVRNYLSGIYSNPAASLRWDAFRVYGGENGTRERMDAATLRRHGVL